MTPRTTVVQANINRVGTTVILFYVLASKNLHVYYLFKILGSFSNVMPFL